jgi:hypothetical protein
VERTIEFKLADEMTIATAMITDLGVADALKLSMAVTANLRTVAEEQRAILDAALGKPAQTSTRTRGGPQRPAAPATQEEALKRVATALNGTTEPLSMRAIQARTGATTEQITAALSELPRVKKIGRKYRIEAGP